MVMTVQVERESGRGSWQGWNGRHEKGRPNALKSRVLALCPRRLLPARLGNDAALDAVDVHDLRAARPVKC